MCSRRIEPEPLRTTAPASVGAGHLELQRQERVWRVTPRPTPPFAGSMKRLATWAFYGVGAITVGYRALYAYAMQPGDPIHIFRKPDAPNYS
jgi:hypothetical protein